MLLWAGRGELLGAAVTAPEGMIFRSLPSKSWPPNRAPKPAQGPTTASQASRDLVRLHDLLAIRARDRQTTVSMISG